MSNRLLTGIGISNFKTIDRYTFIPIKDITVLIGKNGSGKSSSWQVLNLLRAFHPSTHSFSNSTGEANGIEFQLELTSFKEFGNSIETLLFHECEPLIFELASKISIAGRIIKEMELIFRFEFNPSEIKNQLEISNFKVFAKSSKELLFDVKYDIENYISTGVHSDYFSQFLVDILYKIKKNEFEYYAKNSFSPTNSIKEELFKISKEQLDSFPETYFDSEIHPFKISPNFIWDNAPFAVLFKEQLEFDSIISDDEWDTSYPNLINYVYNELKDLLDDLVEETSHILFVNRKLIGHPTRFITRTRDRERILSNSLDQLDEAFTSRVIKTFNFKALPIVSEDDSGELLLLKQGDEDLRNSGSGYWSLTFILYAIAHAVRSKTNIIVLEEPEAHLHPDFQSLLADLLIDASQTFNICFLIETHSEYLTRRLQLRVFEAHNEVNLTKEPIQEIYNMLKYSNPNGIKLDKDDVVINYFKHITERNAEDPVCIAISLNEKGVLSKEYPLTFAGVAHADAKILFDLKNQK